jgi:hypothetical protein
VRPLLHRMVSADGNATVQRLAAMALKNGSPQRDTIVLLQGISADDEADAQLRQAAGRVEQALRRRAAEKR